MAQASRDQDIVNRLMQRFSEHTRSTHDWQCTYDDQGRLTSLSLRKLGLSEVPTEVWQLVNLQKLDLSGNQLRQLPPELGQLTKLRVLLLWDNQLTQLPPQLGQLTHLQTLSLDVNQLTQVPPELGQLTHLHTLYLSSNQLTQVSPQLGQLPNLQTLRLWGNQLTQVPPELGQLTHLQELHLSSNQLTQLPPELGQLTNLKTLYLDRNQLTHLPPQLGQLTNLGTLLLDGNPDLRIPPPEIVSRGVPTVLAYLRDLASSVERYEAKLILVGEGGMGKSSLLRALHQQPFASLPPTHGIDVGTLQVPHPTLSGTTITVHTWDFGGQDIYQATHQFFLTRRSVYLVVWNARLGPQPCRMSFWLDTISTLAPDAHIILVATHLDEWPSPRLDVHAYRKRYPQIVNWCAVSNKDGTGLEILTKLIAAAAATTEFVGQTWPKLWVEAEQQLLSRPEHHIDERTYVECCVQNRIEEKVAKETLGPFLHDLGKILYFHDDLRLANLVVLKPNWISEAISQVLTDKTVEHAGGVVAHRDLARIWATDEEGRPYDPALYPTFVRLMERFDLCYQLEPERAGQAATQSLVPLLLPAQPPAGLPPLPVTAVAGQARIEMRYTLEFVPAGLMSRLLVRTHRYSQKQHWREGARLASQGQQAHVELDLHRREIQLLAWGSFPYTLFLVLKETLEELVGRYEHLRMTRELACTCQKQQHNPHFYGYDLLERQLATGSSTEVTCPESGTRLSLATLLYGLHPGTTTQVVRSMQQEQQAVTSPGMSADELRQQFTRLHQELEFIWHTQMRQWNLELHKLDNPCPSLFVLKRGASHRRINPKDWVSRSYRLHLLCQYPAGPHLMEHEEGYEVREGKEWWNAMSPWLRRLVQVLKMGVAMGKAIGEVFDHVDVDRLAAGIDVLNEVLADMPEITTVESMKEAALDPGLQMAQRLEGPALRALSHFLDTADPGHHWQGLYEVPTPDGTLLWLCERHRREFVAPPLGQP